MSISAGHQDCSDFGMGAALGMFFFFPGTFNAFIQDHAGGCVLSHAESSPQSFPPLIKIFPVTNSKRKALPGGSVCVWT